MYTVYMHRCPNNKVYIGITKDSVNIRWGTNGRRYHHNSHFSYAIKKYGWDNIQHIIIAEDLTKDEACELEKKLIFEHQSNNPKFGYNQTSGGEHTEFSDEVKQRISIAHMGKHLSDEHKEKLRQAQLGSKHKPMPDSAKQKLREYNLGKVMPKEVKDKISKALTENNPNRGKHYKLSSETRKRMSLAKQKTKLKYYDNSKQLF